MMFSLPRIGIRVGPAEADPFEVGAAIVLVMVVSKLAARSLLEVRLDRRQVSRSMDIFFYKAEVIVSDKGREGEGMRGTFREWLRSDEVVAIWDDSFDDGRISQ